MRLSSAAIGLAAVGAGLLVTRMVRNRRGGLASVASPEPPSPDQLIGISESHLSAEQAAETFRESRSRPV